jgi:hypothetical protein
MDKGNRTTGIYERVNSFRHDNARSADNQEEVNGSNIQGNTSDSIQTTPMNEVRFMVDY